MAGTHAISSPRRLILHCGPQKTGSTSFHHFVSANRSALQERVEILTPVKRSPARVAGRTAAHFSLHPTPDNEALLARSIRTLRDALIDSARPAIVSHENLPGAMIGRGHETRLYPHLERIMALLDEHLAPMVPEFVFYTREMPAWKRSVYNQAVKTDGYEGSYAEFVEETADCGTWDELEARMVRAAGRHRTTIFRLEDEPDPRYPGTQLLRHAGIGAAEIAALAPLERQRNQSLNAGALEFTRRVNTLDLPRQARTSIVRLVVRNQSLFVPG